MLLLFYIIMVAVFSWFIHVTVYLNLNKLLG